jgi:hypothetical protein
MMNRQHSIGRDLLSIYPEMVGGDKGLYGVGC